MAMNMVMIDNKCINLDAVRYVERKGMKLFLHFGPLGELENTIGLDLNNPTTVKVMEILESNCVVRDVDSMM